MSSSSSYYQGRPELMAIIPYFKDPTTGLAFPQLSHYLFLQNRRAYSKRANPNFSSSFSFSFSSFSLPCSPTMASSSRRSAGKRKGALAGEGDLPVIGEATAAPRGRGDDGGSSSSSSGPLESLEEVLGRLTVDPWYRSSERFPSVLVTHGWLSEKMPRQMWPGFLPSERSETCKYKGKRFWPYLLFLISSALGLLVGKLG